MFCENEDCDNELTPHQVADGESFCSDECGEESLRSSTSPWNAFDNLFDDPYAVEDDEDED